MKSVFAFCRVHRSGCPGRRPAVGAAAEHRATSSAGGGGAAGGALRSSRRSPRLRPLPRGARLWSRSSRWVRS